MKKQYFNMGIIALAMGSLFFSACSNRSASEKSAADTTTVLPSHGLKPDSAMRDSTTKMRKDTIKNR